MMTWDGHWGNEVDYQYQHYRHHLQRHDSHRRVRLLQHCPESPHVFHLEEEGDVMIQEQTSHYNRISVLAIAPKKLLPMIISQVAKSAFVCCLTLAPRGHSDYNAFQMQALLPFVVFNERTQIASVTPPPSPPKTETRKWKPIGTDFALVLGDEDLW